MTPTEFIAALAQRFPNSVAEIEAWAGEYAAALRGRSPAAVRTALERTLARWVRPFPPKPGEFAKAMPVEVGVSAAAETWTSPEGGKRITAKGYKRARAEARRLVEDAFRLCAEPLTADEASRIGHEIRPTAWAIACAMILDGQPGYLDITADMVARVRAGILVDEAQLAGKVPPGARMPITYRVDGFTRFAG